MTILTVTLNPAVDYVVQLPHPLALGDLNRMSHDVKLPGGKGINVSRILKELGHVTSDTTVITLGFVGGFTGDFVEKTLSQQHGLTTRLTRIAADTRINVKVKAPPQSQPQQSQNEKTHDRKNEEEEDEPAKEETEINGRGPEVSPAEVAAFNDQLESLLSAAAGDDSNTTTVILSGSLTPGLSKDFYFDLISTIRAKGAQFVIDTTGESLLRALPLRPLVVKPNDRELAELFHVERFDVGSNSSSSSRNDDTAPTTTTKGGPSYLPAIVPYARQLLERGAQHALVSLGAQGALMLTYQTNNYSTTTNSNNTDDHAKNNTRVYYSPGPKTGTPTTVAVNSVGAGDSMIAGFTGTWSRTKDAVEAFRCGVACGCATAYSEDLATREKIETLLPLVEVTELEF